jgi:hypothetical protein
MRRIDFDCPCGEHLTAGLRAGDRRRQAEVRFYSTRRTDLTGGPRRPLRRVRQCPRCSRDFRSVTLDEFCRTVFS